MSPLLNASIFIIKSVFDFYIFTLLLRFILQYLRADYYNPVTQFIVKITNPAIVPLRRFIPGYFGMDIATLVMIFVTTFVKLGLLCLFTSIFPHVTGLLIWTFGDILQTLSRLFFYAILGSVILSWVSPHSYSPVTAILHLLTQPLLKPIQRRMPAMGGIDLSPLIAIIILQVFIILISNPISNFGQLMAISK